MPKNVIKNYIKFIRKFDTKDIFNFLENFDNKQHLILKLNIF